MKMTKETKEKEKEKEKVRTKRIFKFPTENTPTAIIKRMDYIWDDGNDNYIVLFVEVNGKDKKTIWFFPNSPRHEGKVAVYMGKYRNDRVEEEHEFSSDASYTFRNFQEFKSVFCDKTKLKEFIQKHLGIHFPELKNVDIVCNTHISDLSFMNTKPVSNDYALQAALKRIVRIRG